MEKVEISQEMVKMQCRKMSNQKAPGKDGVQGYWLKNLASLHPRIAVQLNHILDGERPLPDWMTFGKTALCQKKNLAKGSAVDQVDYRPISCLPLMWKLITVILTEKMQSHLERENVLPSEQKQCCKGSHGKEDLIDKTTLRDCKKRHTNLAMAWKDYKKGYDMVPHGWISECLETFGIANNVQDFLNSRMKSWNLELNASGKTLGEVHIRSGNFQVDGLSSLLFVLCMAPLTWQLRRGKTGYEWGKKEFKLNHLLFMDKIVCQKQEPNRLPGADCAYLQ